MCGICGIHHYQRQDVPDMHVLGRMLASIEHRGPDADGTLETEHVALGMRRLSIIDLPGGDQPIYNETGDIAVFLNGEIYNYVELRESLGQRGHKFKTESDTEVIVHLYEEFGDECVHKLRGMFGFAVWDARRSRLLIARDRLGIKPLYYAADNGRLVFGSEIKALLCHPAIAARIDHAALSLYLSLKYVPAPRTLFAGIQSLPPGHLLTCDSGGVSVRQYWDLAFSENHDEGIDEQEYVDRLEDILLKAVKLHLRSDVPFGAFLSGGLDSSLVVALMSHVGNCPIKTFSVGFEEPGQQRDERGFARIVAQRFKTDHHEVVLRPQDFIRMAETVAWHLDQPLADQATSATYAVSELAAQHVKMVLTGEGGDELFAGYGRYVGESLYPWFGKLPNWMKGLALKTSGQFRGLRRQKLALFAMCQQDEASRMANWFPLFNHDMKRHLLTPVAAELANGSSAALRFSQQLDSAHIHDPLNRMLYVDTKLWLPDLLLMRADKMAMARSLEARVPLLDHEVVEFAASLPTKLKLKGFTTKYLLKQLSKKYLPAEIIHRKKEGFPIPISNWLRGPARPFMRDLLATTTVQRRGLLNPLYVQRLINEHETRRADHGSLLWGLMSLELWHQRFIDSSGPAVHRGPTITALGHS